MDSELKQYLEAMEGRLDKRLGHALDHLETRLTEKMRDMQTELLRGFAAFSEAQTIRLRKVEADQSNLDAALSGRVSVLEKRLLEIELRLGRV
jgi:flagellar biosynthesis/type III secretory pathway protein FliH